MNAFGAALMIWLSSRKPTRMAAACARCGVSPHEECRSTTWLGSRRRRERIETDSLADLTISGCARR
jgi:hypothetical protein